MFRASRKLVLVVAAVCVAVASGAISAHADFQPPQPDAATLAPGDIAIVGGAHISKLSYNEIARVFRRQDGESGSKHLSANAREQIVSSLVMHQRFAQEAAQLGIVITARAVKARFAPLKAQSFPRARDYRLFLKQTGQTEKDLLKLVRSSMLQERVRDSWTTKVVVTDAEILQEFTVNGADYATPENRDLLIIFTSKHAKALRARAALRRGMSFAKVARKYSQDSASKSNGGKFPSVEKEQFEPALDSAIFAARKGRIVGPIKTQYGYYIFKVTAIHPRNQPSLAEATPRIRETLKEAKTEAATEQAEALFKARWKPATLCRAKYAVEDCGVIVP